VANQTMADTAEHRRLREIVDDVYSWRRWGPYVADRAWGTVREDNSPDGNAWSFLTHDHARSKAFRWGEDAIAGWCDRYQFLVLAPAFWNRRDPILKERLFGLTSTEGNHGEDVKEYYFYLDCTPTHSYQKFLYKYPQAEFPYQRLVEENRRRSPLQPEYELLDTGVFDGDRYFDIFVEYAKIDDEDAVFRIEAFNRGPDAAPLDLFLQTWFRNTWGWRRPRQAEPQISLGRSRDDFVSLELDSSRLQYPTSIDHEYRLGRRVLYGPPGGTPLFTDNETNVERCLGFPPGSNSPFVKDAIHRHWLHGEPCVNREMRGTKAALAYRFDHVPAGGSVILDFRFSPKDDLLDPLSAVEPTIRTRRNEADEFYHAILASGASQDERLVQRQSLAGMLWTKQTYLFDVNLWLKGDDPQWPPPAQRGRIRNGHWRHLNSMRVMSVPDKWEYPWFAAWDLAFHCIPLALVDPEFAKHQLWILLFDQFQHPNGQLPAYEWDFSDLNPPVHAWAVWRVYNMDRLRSGKADRQFLERCFHKLLLNFTWWVNRVDPRGNNVFEGGFLGLDNIAVVDRSTPCHDGSRIEQSDATGWMGMFCLNLMRMALELAKENRSYETLAIKFFQHYCYIAGAMKHMGGRDHTLWDESDGFFYDVLRRPDDRLERFRVRSLVGLIPLFAVERLELEWIKPFSDFSQNVDWFLRNRGDLVKGVVHRVEHSNQVTLVCTVVDAHQLSRILDRVWDESEFLAPAGIRSLSKYHQQHPYWFEGRVVHYEPADAITKIKGGNSNWRGPVWFPTCFLLIESLRKLGKAFGPDFQIHPAGTDRPLTLKDLARHIADRLIGVFVRDGGGQRPMFGSSERFQNDPHWRDYLLFYEFFHAETSEGLGASHQTGWTGLVASLIDEWRK
jgi:hypothetical protein